MAEAGEALGLGPGGAGPREPEEEACAWPPELGRELDDERERERTFFPWIDESVWFGRDRRAS